MGYFYHFFLLDMGKYEEDTNAVSNMRDLFGSWESIYLGIDCIVLISLDTGLHIDTFYSNPFYKVAKT